MDLENYTLVELRQLAKEKGIKNTSKLKKEEIIEKLLKLENESIEAKEIEYDGSYVATDVTTSSLAEPSNGSYKLTNADDQIVEGILEVLPDGYGFLRGENYLSTTKDVYI